jgi:Ethanolamine ammonia lyase large subunit (EutB)
MSERAYMHPAPRHKCGGPVAAGIFPGGRPSAIPKRVRGCGLSVAFRAKYRFRLSRSLSSGLPLRAGPVGSSRATLTGANSCDGLSLNVSRNHRPAPLCVRRPQDAPRQGFAAAQRRSIGRRCGGERRGTGRRAICARRFAADGISSGTVVPYETDEVTRLIADTHDRAAFAPVSHLTVGGLRDWLLADERRLRFSPRSRPASRPKWPPPSAKSAGCRI